MLLQAVNGRLERHWSRGRISVSLYWSNGGNTRIKVNPEIVYEARYLQARGSLETEVKRWLRPGLVMRKLPGRFTRAGHTKPMALIHKRSAEAE